MIILRINTTRCVYVAIFIAEISKQSASAKQVCGSWIEYGVIWNFKRRMLIHQIWPFFAVGLIWGVTNPLIKRGSSGQQTSTNKKTANNKLLQIIFELKSILLRWQYIVPFLVNQSGSLLYVHALQDSEISLAVPITQSCTFLFTTLTALCLGEQMPNKRSFVGVAFISIGINICIYSKL